jgi:aminoglycoside phosphotransferase (APT) family kinase protein
MLKPFLEELSTHAFSLSQREPNLFSPPLHWVSLSNGDADFHDNVIFFGFDEIQDEPILVAKVPRLPENGWMVQTEYDHLVGLWNCIGAEAVNYIPKPYALASLQERPALMISYVAGESLTRLPRNSFWGDPRQVIALAREAAQTLRGLNRLTERPVERPDGLYLDLESRADTFREVFQLNAQEKQALAELVRTVHESAKTASHEVLIQGDFWHGNMIRDKERGRLMFVDWQFARWSVDVSMDLYFFLLAGALSASGDGSAQEPAEQAFRRLLSWRAGVIAEYLSAYGRPSHYLLLPEKQGMLLCCVEKAVRSAMDFGYSHPDDLIWRNLFTKLLDWPAGNS